jgi:hypothetical protein
LAVPVCFNFGSTCIYVYFRFEKLLFVFNL